MSDWRNAPVVVKCRTCEEDFTGKYNSRTCAPCKAEARARANESFADRNPTYFRDRQRIYSKEKMPHLAVYNMTKADYEAMELAQDGCCAICRGYSGWRANGGRLVVDHDHETGLVRGLLCPSCNRGLGQFRDSPEFLTSASNYIKESRNK